MRIFPSRSQWKNWSLPSKLTAIGAYVGILGVVLSVIFFAVQSSSNRVQSSYADNDDERSSVQYDTVSVILPSRLQNASIEIDGEIAAVLSRTINTAKLRVPEKDLPQIIEIKTDGDIVCRQQIILASNQILTPCQN